ncbi:hypothetical protein [Flavobacterium sp. N2820]|uniref:hypothetical protein n=1 Tax=Flavobacterium sp. N2820 TaxID=2986834 RepID=UPI002224F781|nr:hypothetical protein [Flavobacterium sp. N2820]
MKTKLLSISALAMLSMTSLFAQEKTTVTASSADISDNLDLRAIASVFGDASNLEDFENRINDPKAQLSNLDLNNDNYVDYLRVIESVEGNIHLVIVQAVLDKDVYQDVATIEIERDRNNRVQVQVVGDVYMYGQNYIYEPVYVHTPVIYNTFWVTNYRPYCSSWYWNYYPSYYYYWNPFPVFRYRNHISVHINFGHSYHYVTHRRCASVYNNYYGRRGNGYETRHPNRSFAHRNAGYTNRQDLDNNRTTRAPRGRNEIASNEPRNSGTRGTTSTPRTRDAEVSPRSSSTPRQNEVSAEPRTSSPRNNSPKAENPRTYSEPRNNAPKATSPRAENPRAYSEPRATAPKSSSQRGYSESRAKSEPKVSAPRRDSGQRNSTPRTNSSSRSSSSRNAGRG